MGAALAQTRIAVVAAVHDARSGWSRQASAAVVVVVLAALAPLLPVDVGRLADDLYLGAAAVGLGIVVGLGGMPSLGQGAFVAIGAFVAAWAGNELGLSTEAAIVAGGLAASLAGAGAGLVAGRLRPAIVAVGTWLLAWLVALALAAFPSLSGGAQGITLDAGSRLETSTTLQYELGVALAALAVLVFAALARSPAGVALTAARESRAAAETLGVPVARLRAAVFALGSGIAGLAGGLGVYAAGVADATTYGPLLSAKLFIAVVLGGAAAAAGGLVGVGLLVLLGGIVELGGLESLQASRIETLIVAVLILSAVGAIERGLLPSLGDWLRSRRAPEPGSLAAGSAAIASVAPTSLQARGLTKRFGAVVALEDVDLDVAPGTVHALIGPNGSGKTTALRVLSGTIEPDAGSVTIGGEELAESGLQARAERGIVGTLQATSVFSELTVLEHALVGARLRTPHTGIARAVLATPKARAEGEAARGAALSALDVVGLRGVSHTRAGELPGSAQRRLMIAAALATRPRVLLLDEPSAGAARAEVEFLAELLGRLRESGLTIVLVEHNLRLVRRVADEVAVLEAGRVIAHGSVDDILEDPAVHRAYLGGRRI